MCLLLVQVTSVKATLCTGRQNGVGLNSVCARVAGILAPLVRLLDVYHYTIPMLIYGIIPIAAGGFCFFLPETLNVELQDHVELKWVDKMLFFFNLKWNLN